jgi:hypothetical protein
MDKRIDRPKSGHLYHGVFPGKHDGTGDDVWSSDLDSYELTVKKKAAWVYFSNEWSRCRLFPRDKAEWIRNRNGVPFIRLMLRSSQSDAKMTGCQEEVYALDKILRGDFDEQLMDWAAAARDFGSPLLVEYGTECNIQSFCWNGVYNGNGEKTNPNQEHADGPTKFIDTYWHIVELMRKTGADNLT